MKLKSLFGFILIAVIFTSTSCKKETLQAITGTMSANIAGAEWTTITQTGLKFGDHMTIAATAKNQTIFLYIGGTAVGKYSLATLEGNRDAGSYYKNSPDGAESVSYYSTTGEVEITSIDTESKRVSGTFTFTAASASMETVEITTGVFNNVKYLEK